MARHVRVRTRTRVRAVRLLAVPAAALAGALALAGCSSGGGPSQRTASAVFGDVGDLANGAQVQLADVPVGSVTSIALSGTKAKVTLAFDNGVRVPANVRAAIDRTTILGDQFVELTVPKSDTGPAAATVPQLANGATITHTSIVPDVEQFVAAGSQVFGAISSSELAQIIEAGGEGFTGQAATLKAFLDDLSSVTNGYAQHTADITQAVNGLNSLTSQLAPNDGATETALDNLAQTVSILAKNSSQFETLLQSLDNVSSQGRSLLETYYPQIVDQLQTLQAVSSQLSQHQADLAGLLSEIPLADNALPQAVRSGYVQLYENIIVCGLPGGGEDDSQPAFSCAKSRIGERLVITRRLVVNLVAFFVVSFGLVAYGVVNLLGNPLESSTTLTTQFPNASGLYSGFEVELNGVPVGTVSSTALTKTGTKVTMSINPGTSVPSDVQSSVQIANDLGEQVVNLVPTRGGPAPALASGADVPAARDDVPADVGQVVATATRLLQAIPAGNLNKLIGEMATALQGNAGNLRTLISAGTTFSKEFVAYQQQFTELLANAPPALDAVTARRAAAAPGPGQHRRPRAGVGAEQDGTAQPPDRGLVGLRDGGPARYERVGQSRLPPARFGRHPLQPRPAHQPHEPVAGPHVQPVLLRRRRQHRGGRPGQADDERQPAGPEPDLPAHPPRHPAHPQRARLVVLLGVDDPRRLPGRRLRDRLRVRRRRGQPARLRPGRRRAGGGADGAGGRRRAADHRHRPLDQHRLQRPAARASRSCSSSA